MDSSPASSFDAFRDLERYLSGQVAANAGLPELERASERRGREILALALPARIDARGDIGTAIVVPSDHGPVRLARQRVHTRLVITLFGEVRVTGVGSGAPGREAIHPLDAELMLAPTIWS